MWKFAYHFPLPILSQTIVRNTIRVFSPGAITVAVLLEKWMAEFVNLRWPWSEHSLKSNSVKNVCKTQEVFQPQLFQYSWQHFFFKELWTRNQNNCSLVGPSDTAPVLSWTDGIKKKRKHFLGLYSFPHCLRLSNNTLETSSDANWVIWEIWDYNKQDIVFVRKALSDIRQP